jgi:HlyD family secretion protein
LLSNRLTPLILVASLVAIGVWMLRLSVERRARAERLSEQMEIATVEATRAEFEVAVKAMGKLESTQSQSVISEVGGQVLSLLPNGVEVKQGDIILTLDVPRMLRELRDQEVQYQEAVDDLQSKKRDLAANTEKARIKLEQARLEFEKFGTAQDAELTQKRTQKEYDTKNLDLRKERFEREKSLAAEGLVPGREVELATAEITAKEFSLERQVKDLELAEAQTSADELDKQAAVTRAEADLARAKSQEEDGIRTASVAVQVRENQLARVRDQVDDAVIRAPVDGIVLFEEQSQGMLGRRPLQPGDQIWPRRPVATIPDLNAMRVALELSQEESALVKPGQEVVITVPALPGQTFPGTVTDIAQTGRDSTFPGTGMPRGERTFPMRIKVDDRKDAPLRPGMTALVRIIVERIPDAVSVPLECVFERDDQHVVYVRRGRDFRAVEVELGPESDDGVVIAKGLEGGEEVSLRDVKANASESTPTGGNESSSALPL